MGVACSDLVVPKAPKTIERPIRSNCPPSRASLAQSDPRVLKDAASLGNCYEMGASVGTDKFVRVTINRENKIEYVTRQLFKSDMPISDEKQIVKHLTNLRALQHVHICRFVEAFNCGDKYEMIYEKATPTSLFEEEKSIKNGKPLSEDTVREYTSQIAMALSVAHKQGIAHGRLSDTSVLYDSAKQEEGDVKLIKVCDFGQSFILRPPRSSSCIEFSAPQIILNEVDIFNSLQEFQDHMKTCLSCDMWALGILAFKMLTGKTPFPNIRADAKIEKDDELVVSFDDPIWNHMVDAKDAVSSLLKLSLLRISAETFLKHAWIAKDREKMNRSKMVRVLQNVVHNAAESTFKKFAMRVIAEDMTSEKFELIRTAFRVCDKNGDGSLDLHEIREVLAKYLDYEEKEGGDIFEAIDRDASGTLSFEEFMAVSMGHHEYLDKETLWHTFNRFDKDGSGEFDQEEIARVVREVEHLAEGSQIQQEVDEIAKDIEMPMDFDTFLHIMYTPTGAPIETGKRDLSRSCWQICKVDCHGVRTIEPKRYDPQNSNQIMKSAYRSGSLAYSDAGNRRGSESSPKYSPKSPGSKRNSRNSVSPKSPGSRRNSQNSGKDTKAVVWPAAETIDEEAKGS